MGAGNVKAAYGLWAHLPDRPFRLLAFMAVTSKDDGDPPVYWGGRDSMAVGIGRAVPPGGAPEAARVRNATFVAVRAAVAQLVKAGAITRTRHPSPGRTAEYALNLKWATGQGNPALNRAGQTCATGQGNPAQQGRANSGTGQGKPAPEEEQDHRGHTSGVDGSGSPASAGPADPSVEHGFEFDHDADDDGMSCRVCGLPRHNRLHNYRHALQAAGAR